MLQVSRLLQANALKSNHGCYSDDTVTAHALHVAPASVGDGPASGRPVPGLDSGARAAARLAVVWFLCFSDMMISYFLSPRCPSPYKCRQLVAIKPACSSFSHSNYEETAIFLFFADSDCLAVIPLDS